MILQVMSTVADSGFLCWLFGEVSTCSVGDMDSIPESEKSSGGGNGNSIPYTCLGNPMDRGAWWATVHEVSELDKNLNNLNKNKNCSKHDRLGDTVTERYSILPTKTTKYFLHTKIFSSPHRAMLSSLGLRLPRNTSLAQY